jgi:hypothetical protein
VEGSPLIHLGVERRDTMDVTARRQLNLRIVCKATFGARVQLVNAPSQRFFIMSGSRSEGGDSEYRSVSFLVVSSQKRVISLIWVAA